MLTIDQATLLLSFLIVGLSLPSTVDSLQNVYKKTKWLGFLCLICCLVAAVIFVLLALSVF